MLTDSNFLSTVATVIAGRVAGTPLRAALAWRIAVIEAAGGTLDRETRKRLVAAELDAGLTRGARVRLGIAVATYQTLAHSPGLAALAIACAAFWIIAAIVALGKIV